MLGLTLDPLCRPEVGHGGEVLSGAAQRLVIVRIGIQPPVRFPLLNVIPLRLPESKRVHLGI